MSGLPAIFERAIILAPLGRDSSLALMMLNEAGFNGIIASHLQMLCEELEHGAGLLVIAAEALRGIDLEPLLTHLHQQPAWSDLPIVLMTHHGGSEQNGSSHLSTLLGNVTFLERPFHPITLISLVTTALRGRRRQYEARDRLIDLSQSEQRLQSTLETLEQQVEERTAQLRNNEEALRQSQKMEAVGQLTGGIAHDFNNMLTGIIGSLDLMQRYIAAGRSDEIGRFTDAAVSSAHRAAALTHRLLAFSRRQSLDRRPLDPNQLVMSLEDLFRRTKGAHIALKLQLGHDIWPVNTDASQLENALLNLVINARDAMPDGGELRIETANSYLDGTDITTLEPVKAGDYVMLGVCDNGTGMAPKILAKAFDPFFTTKPIGQGTGLGLSMIYGFAQQSGGHVTIHSEPGQGTCVRLYLPRLYGTALESSLPQHLGEAPLALAGEAVVVVEDDPAVRMLVVNVLDELGYTAHQAADARTALPLLESDLRVDLLVTDVGLPGMNGRQLAEIARQHRPGLKVLFMTGYAEKAAERQGFLEDGMDMVAKPFSIDLLATKIRSMINVDE